MMNRASASPKPPTASSSQSAAKPKKNSTPNLDEAENAAKTENTRRVAFFHANVDKEVWKKAKDGGFIGVNQSLESYRGPNRNLHPSETLVKGLIASDPKKFEGKLFSCKDPVATENEIKRSFRSRVKKLRIDIPKADDPNRHPPLKHEPSFRQTSYFLYPETPSYLFRTEFPRLPFEDLMGFFESQGITFLSVQNWIGKNFQIGGESQTVKNKPFPREVIEQMRIYPNERIQDLGNRMWAYYEVRDSLLAKNPDWAESKSEDRVSLITEKHQENFRNLLLQEGFYRKWGERNLSKGNAGAGSNPTEGVSPARGSMPRPAEYALLGDAEIPWDWKKWLDSVPPRTSPPPRTSVPPRIPIPPQIDATENKRRVEILQDKVTFEAWERARKLSPHWPYKGYWSYVGLHRCRYFTDSLIQSIADHNPGIFEGDTVESLTCNDPEVYENSKKKSEITDNQTFPPPKRHKNAGDASAAPPATRIRKSSAPQGGIHDQGAMPYDPLRTSVGNLPFGDSSIPDEFGGLNYDGLLSLINNTSMAPPATPLQGFSYPQGGFHPQGPIPEPYNPWPSSIPDEFKNLDFDQLASREFPTGILDGGQGSGYNPQSGPYPPPSNPSAVSDVNAHPAEFDWRNYLVYPPEEEGSQAPK